jgi:hypothetical protein
MPEENSTPPKQEIAKMYQPTHYVSDQIAEGPRRIAEEIREYLLRMEDRSVTLNSSEVDDLARIIELGAATRETRGTPGDLLKQWWEIGKLVLKHEPIPEDEVATLMFETEIAEAATRVSQPVAPPLVACTRCSHGNADPNLGDSSRLFTSQKQRAGVSLAQKGGAS